MTVSKCKSALVAGVLALALIMTGCGGNQTSGGSDQTTAAVSAETSQAATDGSGAASDATTSASSNTSSASSDASSESSAATTQTESSQAAAVTYPLTVTDDQGREIVLEKAPERVVCLSGTTLYMYKIAGGNPIAGPTLSKSAPDPGGLENIVRLGQMANIDVEKLIELNPDFVFIQAMNERLVPMLEENKIPYFYFGSKSFEEIKDKIRLFSQIAGTPQVGEDIVLGMDERIAMLRGMVPPHDPIDVAIVHVTEKALTLKLSNSIAGDVASMLDLKNITEGMEPEKMGLDSVPFDLEMLVAKNPQVILITSMLGADQNAEDILKGHLKDSSAWALLDAVANDRVYYLPQSHFLFNPVDRYDEAVKIIAEKIWPEAFQQ